MILILAIVILVFIAYLGIIWLLARGLYAILSHCTSTTRGILLSINLLIFGCTVVLVCLAYLELKNEKLPTGPDSYGGIFITLGHMIKLISYVLLAIPGLVSLLTFAIPRPSYPGGQSPYQHWHGPICESVPTETEQNTLDYLKDLSRENHPSQ